MNKIKNFLKTNKVVLIIWVIIWLILVLSFVITGFSVASKIVPASFAGNYFDFLYSIYDYLFIIFSLIQFLAFGIHDGIFALLFTVFCLLVLSLILLLGIQKYILFLKYSHNLILKIIISFVLFAVLILNIPKKSEKGFFNYPTKKNITVWKCQCLGFEYYDKDLVQYPEYQHLCHGIVYSCKTIK